MDRSFSVPIAVICVRVGSSRCYTSLRLGALVHRLAYNGDVAAGQLAVFQGGPSRTGGKVPISGLIRKVGNQISGERTTCLKVMSQEQQPSPMRGEDVDMPTRLFRPGAPRTRFLLL